jgi:hypothetical protein
MIKRLPVLIVVAALLAVPSTAAADDQGVWNAYARSDTAAKVGLAGQKFTKAFKRLSRRVTRPRLRAALKASRRLSKAIGPHIKTVETAEPSTEEGEKAKALLIKDLKAARNAARLAARGVKAAQRRRTRRANRLFNRAAAGLRKATKYERQARKILRESGVDTSAKVEGAKLAAR